MLSWLLAPLFGAAYGVAELIPRYRDAPMLALRTWPATVYVGINAIASLAALAVLRTLDVNLGLPDGAARDLSQVMVAGFSAMAVFRSSLFIARVGTEDVPIGPMTVLQAGLDASDRGVDRRRARARATDVREAMADLSFQQAFVELPPLAFNLMQNVTALEKMQLAEAAMELDSSDFDERTKTYVLGLALMRLTGRDALQSAVALLAAPRAGSVADGAAQPPDA